MKNLFLIFLIPILLGCNSDPIIIRSNGVKIPNITYKVICDDDNICYFSFKKEDLEEWKNKQRSE